MIGSIRTGGSVAVVLPIAIVVGCTSQPVASEHPDRLDLTRDLEPSQFEAPYEASLGVTKIELGQVRCRVAVAGQSAALEQAVREYSIEAMKQLQNLELISGEGDGGDLAGDEPEAADLVVNVEVLQVDRETLREEDSNWVWLVGDRTVRREGVVELGFQIVDASSGEQLQAFRTRGILSDERQTRRAHLLPLVPLSLPADESRVPESHAVRAACEEAAAQLFEFLELQQSEAAPPSNG